MTPDDVRDLAAPVLRHRIVLNPEAEIEGMTADQCVGAGVGADRGAATVDNSCSSPPKTADLAGVAPAGAAHFSRPDRGRAGLGYDVAMLLRSPC